MGLKVKTVKAGKRLGWEATLGAIWLLVTAGGVVSFYFVGRGFTVAAQDAWFKTVNSYLAPTWPTLIYGVLVASISSGIVFLIRYFNRRNVAPTVGSLSVEGLTKATLGVQEATKKLEETAVKIAEGPGEKYAGLTIVLEQVADKVDQYHKTSDVRLKSIEDKLSGKGLTDKVAEKLGLSKSEEA